MTIVRNSGRDFGSLDDLIAGAVVIVGTTGASFAGAYYLAWGRGLGTLLVVFIWLT